MWYGKSQTEEKRRGGRKDREKTERGGKTSVRRCTSKVKDKHPATWSVTHRKAVFTSGSIKSLQGATNNFTKLLIAPFFLNT